MNHLTLEQCQKLKEIGFPQSTPFYWADIGYTTTVVIQYGDSHIPLASCPTLEELIEWLGYRFGSLFATINYEYGCQSTDERYTYGKTPIEAVYNLVITVKP